MAESALGTGGRAGNLWVLRRQSALGRSLHLPAAATPTIAVRDDVWQVSVVTVAAWIPDGRTPVGPSCAAAIVLPDVWWVSQPRPMLSMSMDGTVGESEPYNGRREGANEEYAAFEQAADAMGVQQAEAMLRRLRVPGDVLEDVVRRFEHHAGEIRKAHGPQYVQNGHRITWYRGPQLDDRCWPPLVDSLRAQAWDPDNLKALDDSSSLIVSLLDHPRTHTFLAKGLVLGHVQSGKTTNFTSVAAKAADRGYRLFIVLAGVHNELRRQTQVRLVRQLVDPNPEFWHQLTGPEHDFQPTHNAPAFFGRHSQQPVLCVVKKNGAVLRKLIAWLEEAGATLEGIPALVIDDEADQAAVATATINPLIRRLLGLLPRSAYVGYTATPFANLLIDPAADDLYPRDFIVDLPKPKGHYGTEVLFGREPLDGEDPGQVDDGWDMIRIVPDDEVGDVRPLTSRDVDGFAPQLSGSLREAVLWFWLATAARRHRGTGVQHSTMLVHTSLRVPVHQSFQGPLRSFGEKIAQRLDSRDVDLLAELRAQWDREAAAVPAGDVGEGPVRFDDLAPHLVDVVGQTRVVLDNSMSEERLDYSGEPVVAIAVGGNTLSRGLTLEGLVSSFFVRSSTAYDTLLQMGRWFGYRDGYADLPRIWMTRELEEWFRHLAGVEAEMRRDIARYMVEDETPLTFAVRIRSHPALAITAAAKMRDAVQVSAAYGGIRVQTRYFKVVDENWLKRNQEAAKSLVGAASATGCRDGNALWRDVDADAVLSFLHTYRFHDISIDGRTDLLVDYINERRDAGALELWNVAVMDRGFGEPFDFGSGVVVPSSIRARLRDSPDDAADIKTLMSRPDAALDLPDLPPASASEAMIRELRQRQLPDHGLLVLYAIDAVSRPDQRNVKSRRPLAAVTTPIGVGLVFPRPERDSVARWSADLSRVAPAATGDVEREDVDALMELD